MALSATTENSVLKALLKGTDMAFRTDATQYLALFTADPGDAGSIANEVAYTGYARVPLTKASAWTDNGSTFNNAALVQFGQCTAGSAVVTHFAVVDKLSGAVTMMISGALTSSLSVSSGIQPQFSIGSLSISCE
jgi:hypothetical protein